jgi:hypothetical protein
VEEYVEAFELLSLQVGRLPEDQYLGYFMSGLKPTIRRRVRTLNPKNRMEMMRIAKDVEEELKEDDNDGGRSLGKKLMGRNEGNGPKFRNGFNSTHKEFSRSGNSGWTQPIKKTGPMSSNYNSTARKTSKNRN